MDRTSWPSIVKLAEVSDRRGKLKVFELGSALPFTPVRCFVISDVPEGETRGGHAVSCDEFLVVLRGECRLSAVRAEGQKQYPLSEQTGGIFVPSGTWFELNCFTAGTIVAVFADKPYAETSYHSLRPSPGEGP